MSWIEFIPPIYSTFMILCSTAASFNLRERVHRFVSDKGYKEHEDVIVSIALSWETYVNFHNFFIAYVISIIVIFSKVSGPHVVKWLMALVVPVLIVSIVVFYYINGCDVDDLDAKYVWKKVKPAHLCNIVLILANCLLCFATYKSQQFELTTSSTPVKSMPATKSNSWNSKKNNKIGSAQKNKDRELLDKNGKGVIRSRRG